MAVSFDLFGTLVAVERPADPAAAVAAELDRCGVPVPDDWQAAYREPHVDAGAGEETPSEQSPDEPSAHSRQSLAETPLPAHVQAALESRGVECSRATARDAVLAAFDADVQTRDGATAAVEAAAVAGPVGVLSNCSVPGLAERALDRSAVPEKTLDAVVASVDAGWRKPDPRAFDAVAAALGVDAANLVHVGDDPRADGGVAAAGGTAVLLTETPLSAVPDRLEVAGCR